MQVGQNGCQSWFSQNFGVQNGQQMMLVGQKIYASSGCFMTFWSFHILVPPWLGKNSKVIFGET